MELVFPGFLFPLASHLFFFISPQTWPKVLPDILMHLFAAWILAWKPIGDWQHLLWDSAPPLFDPQVFHMCAVLEILDLRSDRCNHLIFLFQQSSASAVNFILEMSREAKVQFVSRHPSCSAQGPTTSCVYMSQDLLRNPHSRRWQWVWLIFASPWITPWAEMYQQLDPLSAGLQGLCWVRESGLGWSLGQEAPYGAAVQRLLRGSGQFGS